MSRGNCCTLGWELMTGPRWMRGGAVGLGLRWGRAQYNDRLELEGTAGCHMGPLLLMMLPRYRLLPNLAAGLVTK